MSEEKSGVMETLRQVWSAIFDAPARNQHLSWLAERIEGRARLLSGLPLREAGTPPSDPLATLDNALRLLEQLTPPMVEPVTPGAGWSAAWQEGVQPGITPDDPLVRDLIELHGGISNAVGHDDAATLRDVYAGLGRVLLAVGVTVVQHSGSFDRQLQQVVGTQTTTDSSLNDYIYRTVHPGYLYAGRLLRPQEVIIYHVLR